MYKIEQIDWETVDAMIATQIVRVVDMIREIDVTQELDSKKFDNIKATIIERTVDSIVDQLYRAFGYEGDMEYDRNLLDSLVHEVRRALEADDIIDHIPIREEIRRMYRFRLLIERNYIDQRKHGIYTRLEEIDSQTD